jgi:hypothetical protein
MPLLQTRWVGRWSVPFLSRILQGDVIGQAIHYYYCYYWSYDSYSWTDRADNLRDLYPACNSRSPKPMVPSEACTWVMHTHMHACIATWTCGSHCFPSLLHNHQYIMGKATRTVYWRQVIECNIVNTTSQPGRSLNNKWHVHNDAYMCTCMHIVLTRWCATWER